VLLADEPTGNLDTGTGDEIMATLDRLNAERGLAVVLVTHDAEVAARARRQVHLRDGVVQSDSAALSTGPETGDPGGRGMGR
jgi:putative ABC transport system ATP-binding protein